MTSPRPTSPASIARIRPRSQGVAIILALIAVAIAVVLGLAVSSTRDATVVATDQIVRLSQSRLSAKTSVDLANFVVRNHTSVLDASGLELARVVYADKQIGNSIYSASITDATTGMGPTRSTVAIKVEASAREVRPPRPPAVPPSGPSPTTPTPPAASDAIVQTINAVVRVPWPDAVARADIDLSEFALLASTTGSIATPGPTPKITIGAGAEVSVWRAAPLAALGDPIVIGSMQRDPQHLSISGSARLNGVQLLTAGPFARSLEDAEKQLADGVRSVPEEIHVPRLQPVTGLGEGYSVPSKDIAFPYPQLNSLSWTPHMSLQLPPSGRFERFPLTFAGTLQPGQWRIVRLRGLSVQVVGSRWTFEVPTTLVIEGKLELLDGTRFEVGARGALTIVALDGVMVSDSYIGPALGADSTWSTTGAQPYGGVGASRVTILEGGNPNTSRLIYGIGQTATKPTGVRRDTSGGTNPTIFKDGTRIIDGGAVVGEIYAPDSLVSIGSNCALYGRALANQIDVAPGGRVLYDPQLDTGAGWLNPRSGIWGGSGSARPEVRSVALLNDEYLARFSTTTGLAVGSVGNDMLMTARVEDGGFVKKKMDEIELHHGAGNGGPTGLPGPISGTTTPVGVPSDDYVFPGSIWLSGTIRDFRGTLDVLGHPDFGLPNTPPVQRWTISPRLDRDGKPSVSKPQPGASSPQRTIHSEDLFATWFRDTPCRNIAMPIKLLMGRVKSYGYTDQNPTWVYNVKGGSLGMPADRGYNDAYYSVTGVTRPCNTSWTVELGCSFEYRKDKGQWLYVSASNDLFIYLDGKLLVDIGGRSQPTTRSVDLNSIAASFGLVDRQRYALKFFVANRYVVTPPDFSLWMNFPFTEDPMPEIIAFSSLEDIKRVRNDVAARFRAGGYAALSESDAPARPRILGFSTDLAGGASR